MKRLFLIISVLSFSIGLSAQSLTILHMNDTHSHIEPERSGEFSGYGGVIEQASYIDSVRLADGVSNVLLLHAGDFSQGSSYFTEMGGDIEIDVLNAMAFDVVCLGNHEFDNGMAELARRMRNLDVPVVCANYDFTGSPLEGLIKPFVTVEKAGRKIGVIGLLTDITSVVSSEIAVFLKYNDPVQVVQKYASELKQSGCNLVIALTHIGYEGLGMTDLEIAASTEDVDIIVGGHSHTYIEKPALVKNVKGKKVAVVTDGKWGLNIGKLVVR